MNAINRPFTKIINGATQFVIPVFQRDYNWTEDECEQLWKDVLTAAEGPTEHSHFLGSLVYIATGDSSPGFTRWLLIDGQQRVTTLTLLLIALRDFIADSGWKGSEDGPTAKRIDAYFLKNVEEEGARHLKLALRRHDEATLRALLNREELPQEVSEHIRDNCDFFREQIEEIDPEIVYRGIGRLIIIDVTLDRGIDDPQLIFESLNSTGMDLSQSDLIRNFILMRLPEKEQTRLYEAYWCKIEDLFRGSENTFDTFVRDYLALRKQASKQEKADAIYFAFRREFSSIGSDPENLDKMLKELLRFARYHAAFSIGSGAPELLRESLARLRRLVDVPATLIMSLFECFDSAQTLTSDEFARAIFLLESYVMRRAICGMQTRSYWQVFANLAYSIDPRVPFESLTVGLARLRDTYRFPDDAEFQKALEDQDIYGKRVCFDLLDRLENYGSKETTDTSKYSIEHIMPQNDKVSREWKKMLGQHWQEVHREWLHRLGNLTLTGYNTKYSDRPFAEKKTISDGFSDSAVRLNKFVREAPVWTAVEMEQRGKDLANRALTIWPPLVVKRALIEAAAQAEMRARAKRRDVSKVPMTAVARNFFAVFREKVLSIDSNIIELPEAKSVSYHCPSFFLEVLPRKDRIMLLLSLDFNEVPDPAGIARDASERKFFVNAVYEGGVTISILAEPDIDHALPLIRHAWELARA